MANDTNQFGPWQLEEIASFFSALTVPWWIAGGWAIDLFLPHTTGSALRDAQACGEAGKIRRERSRKPTTCKC